MFYDKEYLKRIGFIISVIIFLMSAAIVIDTFSSIVATTVADEGDIELMAKVVREIRTELYSLELDPKAQEVQYKALEQLELVEATLRQLESCVEEK